MIDFNAPLALAFAAGMVATVNPCGFAMLPAYLSYFLGIDERAGGTQRAGVARAVKVGMAVSAGFLSLFAVVGAVVEWSSLPVLEYSPWISIVIGATLVVLGVAMLRGYEPRVALPRLQRGGRDTTTRSMFLFGLSYATVSLGCTLPTFLASLSGTTNRESALSGAGWFLAFSTGMALVLMTLTVTLALARRWFVRLLRRSQPHINRVAGALLLVAGAYVAYYGWYERTRLGEADPIVDRVTRLSDDVRSFVTDQGPTRVGLVLALALAAVLAATVGVRARRET